MSNANGHLVRIPETESADSNREVVEKCGSNGFFNAD